jgi:hypothetical protein
MQTFQDTFKFQDQTWGHRDCQQQIVSAKMHLVPVIQLKIEIARTHCHQILGKQSQLTECRFSKTLSNSKIRHLVVDIVNKMCWQNASGSSHPTWNRNRENRSPPNSEDTVTFTGMQCFQGTFKLQERTWGCWDIQQNVSDKMHQVNQAAAYSFFAWWICCTFLGIIILHVVLVLPSKCSSCMLVTEFPSPFITAVIWWRWYHACSVIDSNLLRCTLHFWMKRIMWFLKMQWSSAFAYICYKAMFIVQSLFFTLQNECMNCIEILDGWMLHSCCNNTCITFCDLFWFAMSNASRWCKCYHFTWKNPLRSWCYIQVLDMMQRIPLLSYACTALTKWSPQIWECAMICNTLVVFTSALFWMLCCCCIDTWHVVEFTCQIMCQVGLKPLETLSTSCTTSIRCWHPCWLR